MGHYCDYIIFPINYDNEINKKNIIDLFVYENIEDIDMNTITNRSIGSISFSLKNNFGPTEEIISKFRKQIWSEYSKSILIWRNEDSNPNVIFQDSINQKEHNFSLRYWECKNHLNLINRIKKYAKQKINILLENNKRLERLLDEERFLRQDIINKKNEEFMIEWAELAKKRNSEKDKNI